MKFTPPTVKPPEPIKIYVRRNVVIVENSSRHPKNDEIKSALVESKWTVEDHLLSDGYAVYDREFSTILHDLVEELTHEYKE